MTRSVSLELKISATERICDSFENIWQIQLCCDLAIKSIDSYGDEFFDYLLRSTDECQKHEGLCACFNHVKSRSNRAN